MHKCTKCGTEFDGKFCPECGEKFVDKDVCPQCGAHHKPDAKFCTECGARLDGKKYCLNCGALMEGDSTFCAECGTKIDGSSPKKARAAAATHEKVKFGFYLSGIICVLLSGLMGLIFAFLTGFAPKSGTTIGSGTMLYHFFGDAYKGIDTTIEAIKNAFKLSSIGSAREFAIYFPIVLGTVISAVGLLGVVALSALTAYQCYRKFYKKQEVNVVAPAVATYLTFATLATLLLVLVGVSADGNMVSFSKPTLAGLITGGVLCGAGLLILAGVNYKKFIGFKPAVGTAVAAAVSALFVVVFALMVLPAVELTDGSESGALSPFYWLTVMLMAIAEDEKFFELLAYALVCGLAAVAVTVITAVNLFRKVPPISEAKNKSNIILGAVGVGLAVVYLTFTILLGNMVIDVFYAKMSSSLDFAVLSLYLAVPITILVMSVLAFGVEVAGKFIVKGDKPAAVKAEVAEEPVQTEETQAE